MPAIDNLRPTAHDARWRRRLAAHEGDTMTATTGHGLLVTTALLIASLPAQAMSNQAFADEVRHWRGQMAQSAEVLGDAALLCTNLSRPRADEEPRCVALDRHLRAQVRAARRAAEAAHAGSASDRSLLSRLGNWLLDDAA